MYRPTESSSNKFITKMRKNKNNIVANNNRNANTVFKISRKLYIPTRSAPLGGGADLVGMYNLRAPMKSDRL